ncbi:MAG: hypothetical protein MI924_00270 [Chloroflexales bacterium]|nr:hypothetical protein [Chloroflexales bacterium]
MGKTIDIVHPQQRRAPLKVVTDDPKTFSAFRFEQRSIIASLKRMPQPKRQQTIARARRLLIAEQRRGQMQPSALRKVCGAYNINWEQL